jgi:hypothetical protein
MCVCVCVCVSASANGLIQANTFPSSNKMFKSWGRVNRKWNCDKNILVKRSRRSDKNGGGEESNERDWSNHRAETKNAINL